MKMEKFFSINGKVFYGIFVTKELLDKLKEKFPSIYIPKNNSENLSPREDGTIGAIMSRRREEIEAFIREFDAVETISNDVGDGSYSWFVGLDALRGYKTKNDMFNFCELRNLARNGIIRKFARKGWNGKGMFIVYVPGSEIEVREGTPYWNAGLRGNLKIDPHFDMYTAQGTMQPGWVCSQADMDADDWVIVE